MRSVVELSKVLECCPLDLNKILLKNNLEVRNQFGVDDGFISEELDEFIKERYHRQFGFVFDIEEIISRKSQLIPITEGSYIYFLLQDDEIVYVGQTVQLTGRIQAHLNASGKVFNYVSIFQVERSVLDEIEQIHIYTLAPPLNKTIFTKLRLVENILRRYRY